MFYPPLTIHVVCRLVEIMEGKTTIDSRDEIPERIAGFPLVFVWFLGATLSHGNSIPWYWALSSLWVDSHNQGIMKCKCWQYSKLVHIHSCFMTLSFSLLQSGFALAVWLRSCSLVSLLQFGFAIAVWFRSCSLVSLLQFGFALAVWFKILQEELERKKILTRRES